MQKKYSILQTLSALCIYAKTKLFFYLDYNIVRT